MVPLCLQPRQKTFCHYLSKSTLLLKRCFISCEAVVMDGDFEDEENHVGLSYQLVIYFKISSEDPYSASPPTASPEPSPAPCKVGESFLLASAAPCVKQVCKNQNIQQIPRVPGLGKQRTANIKGLSCIIHAGSQLQPERSYQGGTRTAARPQALG